jgi:hypothetical protein
MTWAELVIATPLPGVMFATTGIIQPVIAQGTPSWTCKNLQAVACGKAGS